jgi:septal ring factor EnvC (AmiA/AmiB activator)
MTLFRQICFLLLASCFVFSQSAPNNTNTDDSRISNQIKSLQDAIASQQQQIESLRQELAARKQAESVPHLANASLTTSSTTSMVQETERPKESPLSFRIGGTDFTPGGFVDSRTSFGQ